MENYIDLHMHSLYSDDGEFTPTQLVQKCHDAGVRIMAIADHNSVKANQEAMMVAKQLNMSYIPAIEIDCTYKGINLHVLGYGIDYTHQDFEDVEENVLRQELASSADKLKLTNALGFALCKEDMDSVSENGIYTGEMFCEVLLAKPEYKDSEVLKPYRQGGARDDNPFVNFYWDYYAQGKPCYSDIVFPSLQDAIAMIKRHGGVSVLAHPGNNLKGKFDIIDEMITLGLQGVEAFSNYHDEETMTYFYQKGLEKNVLITCGSDYHGKTKPAICLGECRCTIDEVNIEKQLREANLL